MAPDLVTKTLILRIFTKNRQILEIFALILVKIPKNMRFGRLTLLAMMKENS